MQQSRKKGLTQRILPIRVDDEVLLRGHESASTREDNPFGEEARDLVRAEPVIDAELDTPREDLQLLGARRQRPHALQVTVPGYLQGGAENE